MAFTLRTDDELDAALTALASERGLSRQEVIRRTVLQEYARTSRQARVEQAADEMIERWGDVLDRLGRV